VRGGWNIGVAVCRLILCFGCIIVSIIGIVYAVIGGRSGSGRGMGWVLRGVVRERGSYGL